MACLPALLSLDVLYFHASILPLIVCSSRIGSGTVSISITEGFQLMHFHCRYDDQAIDYQLLFRATIMIYADEVGMTLSFTQPVATCFQLYREFCFLLFQRTCSVLFKTPHWTIDKMMRFISFILIN